MKLNQFARQSTEFFVKKQELLNVGFQVDGNFRELVRNNFDKLFPEAKTKSMKIQQQSEILVSKDVNLANFLKSNFTEITCIQFYNIELQLLGFVPIEEYSLENPLEFMKKTKLPYLNKDINNSLVFLEYLYLLLNTRTKNMINYLDSLANHSFFINHKNYNKNFLYFNGKVQNVFSTQDAIKEVVWVESDLDTDYDGKKDLLQVEIIRPKATEFGLKAPIIFTANPYFYGTNDVSEVTHRPSDKLLPKKENYPKIDISNKNLKKVSGIKSKKIVKKAELTSFNQSSYSLNEYFLARGFINVYSAGVGTKGSDGLRSIGGKSKTESAVAVIEWLTGKRKAFTNKKDGFEIKAWWSNKQIAMTGKSYLGTLAIAAATTGVEGLKTIISEAAISSWYDYYRENGLVVAPGGYQGEDADVLAVDTFSRKKSIQDYLKIKKTWEKELSFINKFQDRETGNYNEWWDERNYRNKLSEIKCDIVSVHGLNDWNVKPKNVIKLFSGLSKLPISKKLLLHQGQHIYINNMLSLDFTDMMNLWLTNELLGIENEAKELPNVLIQDNLHEQTWNIYDKFEPSGKIFQYNLASNFSAKKDRFTDNSVQIFTKNKDTSQSYEKEIINPKSIYEDSRILLESKNNQEQIIMGTPSIKIKLKIDKPTAILSVRLIDLGNDYRFAEQPKTIKSQGYQLGWDTKSDDIVEFEQSTRMTESKLITLGHINVQNQINSWKSEKIIPGKEFQLEFELQPTYYHLAKGHRLGVVIHGADMAQTHRVEDNTNYQINLKNSILTIPYAK